VYRITPASASPEAECVSNLQVHRVACSVPLSYVERTVLLRRGPIVHADRQLSLVILRSQLPSIGNSNMKLGLQCFGFSVFGRDLAVDIFFIQSSFKINCYTCVVFAHWMSPATP
jgi:hypothetical protein